jgi:hypothetical protein
MGAYGLMELRSEGMEIKESLMGENDVYEF